MHRPPLFVFQSNDNSRHLADLGTILSQADPPFNIRAIGGGEGPNGVGVFAVALDDDAGGRDDQLRDLATSNNLEMRDVDGLTFELNDEPGTLGVAAGVLQAATINIESILVVGAHGDRPIVLIGVPLGSGNDARTALEGAGYFVYPDSHIEFHTASHSEGSPES
jgi:hypothetical protein